VAAAVAAVAAVAAEMETETAVRSRREGLCKIPKIKKGLNFKI